MQVSIGQVKRNISIDSFYLALAEKLNCELWTADLRLVDAISQPWVRLAGTGRKVAQFRVGSHILEVQHGSLGCVSRSGAALSCVAGAGVTRIRRHRWPV